ncbi:hypothetical protein CBS147311_7906 [Penicillium roqueforti]|nr:hypothetical protein CBS147311_7906 [Penicillium roqueforti]
MAGGRLGSKEPLVYFRRRSAGASVAFGLLLVSAMPLNSQSKQVLSQTGRSKEHRQVYEIESEDEVATLPCTVSNPNSEEPNRISSPPVVEAGEAGEKQPMSLDFSKLRLDSVKSEDPTARILLYPRASGLEVSSYGGSGGYDNWVEVETGDSSEGTESVKVLVVAPNAKQLGCTITHDDVIFHLYFDPAQDRLILRNGCLHAILGRRLNEDSVKVQPSEIAAFHIGCWAIDIEDRTLIEFEFLPRTQWMISARLATKRAAPISSAAPAKRVKLGESTYRATEPSCSLQAVSAGNALVKLGEGDTMYIGADGKGYRLTRNNAIADQPNSSVWQAKHSDMPGKVIVVKVIKATSTSVNHALRAVESWIRESAIHSSLESHSAVLQMLGSDARFQSIYTEYVDAKSLVRLRQPASDTFTGNASDVRRILADMASALDFVHSSRIVHNDVKPANILYSPARGAVLIDFGLSFVVGRPPTSGGSPWYLPPEFLHNWRSRGPLADMWALGVVTLWLLGRIPLPEKTTGWLIADIHPSSPGTQSHMKAMETMSYWLNQVKVARSKLNEEAGSLTYVVKDLLAPKLKERINAETLNKRMTKEGLPEHGK